MLSPEVRSLAVEAQRLLTYQRELGLVGINVPESLLSLVSAQSAPLTESAPSAPRGQNDSSRESRRRASEELQKVLGHKIVREPKPATQVAKPDELGVPKVDSGHPLATLQQELHGCTRCKLHKGRTNLVFGVGNPNARLMFVGEGPGRDEDLQGEPFVGKAGQLLDRMIVAMGIERADVYIANIVKCRPPRNRDPEGDEVEACEPFLQRQIRAVQPEVIVALGRYASQTLARQSTAISRMRGKWLEYEGIALLPTFHPAYLLRNPAEKKPVWLDLQQVMGRLGLEPPARR